MDYHNDEIRLFATWLKASKLFMKVKKTKIMIFMNKQKKNCQRRALSKLMTKLLRTFNTSNIQVFTQISILHGKCIFIIIVQKFLNQQECLLHYSPASCHPLLDLHISLLSLSIVSLFSHSNLFSPSVLPAPIHAVLFPASSCSFGPLLWLLFAPMQEDCCSWTLKTQHSKVLCSVQTMQKNLKLEGSLR